MVVSSHWPNRIALACALAAGLVAILTAVSPNELGRLDTAVVLGCSALGLACLGLGQRRAGAVFGGVAFAIGLASVFGYAIGWPIARYFAGHEFGSLRMPPHTALASACLGAALLLNAPSRNARTRAVGIGALSGAVVALSLATLAAHTFGLHSLYGWTVLTRMPLIAAFALLGMSAGLIALTWHANSADRHRYGLGIAAMISAGLIASVCLSAVLLGEEGRSQSRLARAELSRLRHALGVVAEVHAIGFDRMAQRWNREESNPVWRWHADALDHLTEASAFVKMAWIDAEREVHWAQEEGSLALTVEEIQMLERRAQSGTLTRTVAGFPERRTVTAVVSLGDDGFLLALVSIDALLNLSWGDTLKDLRLDLSDSEGALFEAGPDHGEPQVLGESGPIPFRDVVWQLHVAPPGTSSVGAAPALAFVAGVFLTLVASLAMALRRTALERAESLEELSHELESSASQLMHTNAELVRSNRELARFATLASHDLQEPLRQITSFSDRLIEKHQDKLDEHGQTYLGFIGEAAARARSLIEDLLQYARVDGQSQKREIVDCNVALASALEHLSEPIEESGARVSSDSLPSVLGNPALLVSIFQNLIGNAIKYRSDEPPRIRIRVTDAGGNWRFSVEDNGLGIDPSYHEKIFELFERLHTEGEEKEGEVSGTGIGLALCRKIVERLGGEIALESSGESGSLFWFTLPKLAAS